MKNQEKGRTSNVRLVITSVERVEINFMKAKRSWKKKSFQSARLRHAQNDSVAEQSALTYFTSLPQQSLKINSKANTFPNR